MEFFILFVLSLVPLLWINSGSVILGHDSGFRLYNFEHLKNLALSWHPNANFGIDWSLYHGFIPIQVWESLFRFFTGSLSWGQRLTFVFWFFAIGMSLYIFLRYFFPERKYLPLRLMAPAYWMYNFYILGAWTIAERAKFSLYIALPLMIVIFFRTIRKEWTIAKGGVFFGFLFFFLNGGGSPPLYGGILVTFGILCIVSVLENVRNNTPRVLGIISIFGAMFILLNAYWILPQARLFTGNYQSAVSDRGGIDGLIAWEREISKFASIPNILRLQGFPDWYNNPKHPYANTYLTNPFFIAVSLLPISIVLLGFVFFRKSIHKKDHQILLFLGILGVVGLFFASGSHPPFGMIYTYFMRHIPGFAVFRSSFYKFAPTVYLPVIVFFGYFLSVWFARYIKKQIYLVLVSVGVLVGIVLYHFPYVLGNFFVLKDGFSTRLTVPSYVTDVGAYIAKYSDPTDRILLLPPLDTGFINSPIDTYTWGYYSLDVLPRILVNRSFLANDSNDDSLVRLLYKSLQTSDEQTFLHLAQAAGITHALWRGDVKLTLDTQKQMSVSDWEKVLADSDVLRLTREVGAWRLYAVESRDISPMVHVAKSVSLIASGATNDSYAVANRARGLPNALLSATDDGVDTLIAPDELFIEAECFYCKQNEYTKLVEAFRLFIPFSSRQMKQTEKIIKQVSGKPQEIDARLSLASLYLSQRDIQSYKGEVQKIINSVMELKDRQRDVYSTRVMAYMDAHRQDTGEESIRSIQPIVWKAEDSVYRFGVTVPKEGVYTVWIPDPDRYTRRFTIDTREYLYGDMIQLSSGYHRLALTTINTEGTTDAIVPVFLKKTVSAKTIEIPLVTFRQENPTRYEVDISDAKEPFALIFNQRFDTGWGLTIDGIRQNYFHTQANGFANAWIVQRTGTYTLSLYYTPQQQVYVGSVVTGISILGAFVFLVMERKKRIV